MFVLDSFLHWVLTTVTAAADAEMHDDAALREQLLEAEMQRELGELSDEEYAAIEADLLARMREIARRRQRADPDAAAPALERAPGETFRIEASVTGEFHEPEAPGAPPRPGPPRAADRNGPARRVAAGTHGIRRRRRTRAPASGQSGSQRARRDDGRHGSGTLRKSRT